MVKENNTMYNLKNGNDKNTICSQDEEYMLRQMCTLYSIKQTITHMSLLFSTDVKLELFKHYCTSFYCYLWTAYNKSTVDKLYVYHRISSCS